MVKNNQGAKDILYILEQMLEQNMRECYQELKDSGFYDVDDFDAPSTHEQDMVLAKQEAYEDMLIEVLHMQGKRYYLEVITDALYKEFKDSCPEWEGKRKINLTYLVSALPAVIKS